MRAWSGLYVDTEKVDDFLECLSFVYMKFPGKG